MSRLSFRPGASLLSRGVEDRLEKTEMPLSEHEREVAGHYDDITEVYLQTWNAEHIHFGLYEAGDASDDSDEFEAGGFERALERMIDAIVAPAGIRETDHVVDAGCGVGGTAFYLARKHGCAVTGVNLSTVQLEIANGRALESDLGDRVRFEYADCSRHLPFADESVDAVVNIESACHYSNRGTFFREVNRILKPGGRLVASDCLTRDGLTPAEVRQHIVPLCRLWAWAELESIADYSRKLADAGLVLVEFQSLAEGEAGHRRAVRMQVQRLWRLWVAGLPGSKVRRVIAMMDAVFKAASGRFLQLGRYCAEKPRRA